MKRVEQHHELMIKIQKHRSVFINPASPRIELVRLEETQPPIVATHSTGNRSQARQSSDSESTDAIDENDNTSSTHSGDFESMNNSNDDDNSSEHLNTRNISSSTQN